MTYHDYIINDLERKYRIRLKEIQNQIHREDLENKIKRLKREEARKRKSGYFK